MSLILSRSVNDYIARPGRFDGNRAVVLCGQKCARAASNGMVALLAFTVDLSVEDIGYDMVNVWHFY